MFLDRLLRLSAAQALTATGNSTDHIDLGGALDVGNGEPVGLHIQVNVAADAGNSDETYEFQVIQSANADLSSHTAIASRVIARGSLTAGSTHYVPIPKGAVTQRYLGARYVLGGTTPSITVTAHFLPHHAQESIRTYADGFTIS